MDSILLNPFDTVAANTRAVLTTDQLRGYSLHALIFKMGGTAFTEAHIDNIRLRVGGKTILDTITGAQLGKLHDYEGVPDDTNYLIYWFGDPTARTIRGQHLGDFDFSQYDEDLEIQVNIGGATAPTLEVRALVGVSKKAMDIGFNDLDALTFKAMVPTQIDISAAVNGKALQIAGGGLGSRTLRIDFFHTNLTKLTYKKAGFEKWEEMTIADNAAVASAYGRAAQSGLFVLDRIVDGNMGEAETTVGADGKPWNQQFKAWTSAGDVLDVLVETHTVLALL